MVFVIDGLSGPEAVPFITFSNRPGCPLQREIDRRSESVFLDEGVGLKLFAKFLTNEKAPRH